MTVVATIARIGVGVLLLWASVAKLSRREDVPGWLEAYGIPARSAGPLALVLVAVEAGLGALLLAGLVLPWSAYAAVGLGLVFVLALAQARARGITRLRCACFGAREGRTTLLLLRALGFTGLAALAAFGDGLGAPSRDTLVVVALAVLAAAVVVLGLLVLALYRQVGVLTLRLGPRVPLELAEEGPAVGALAPALEHLGEHGSELVVFFSPGCRLCRQLAPGVAALAREGVPVRLVHDDVEEEAFARWNVPGTPFAVALAEGRVAAKGTVNTLEELDELLLVARRRAHVAA
jgi:uncharacterized membrane protein YphA (DoxX/SURF4 family)